MGNKTLLLIMRKSLGWAQFSSIDVTTPLKTNMDTQTWWALENVCPYTSVHFWYQFVKRLGCKTESLSISSYHHPPTPSIFTPVTAAWGDHTSPCPAASLASRQHGSRGSRGPQPRVVGPLAALNLRRWYRWWKVPWVSLHKAGYKNPTSPSIINHPSVAIRSKTHQ